MFYLITHFGLKSNTNVSLVFSVLFVYRGIKFKEKTLHLIMEVKRSRKLGFHQISPAECVSVHRKKIRQRNTLHAYGAIDDAVFTE